jgi:hypothetical protein
MERFHHRPGVQQLRRSCRSALHCNEYVTIKKKRERGRKREKERERGTNEAAVPFDSLKKMN